MRLVVLVHGRNLEGMSFAPDRPNPGIGGTQFTRIRLADAFARRFPEHTVEVITERPIAMLAAPPNLHVQSTPFESFLVDLTQDVDDWVLTAPSMVLTRLPEGVLRAVAPRTIVTSHLMHDADLWDVERITRFGAAGCVGAYHFHATQSHSPKVYLRDLFHPGWDQPAARTAASGERSDLRIVHIGALLPLKGFDDLARIWSDIRTAVPNVTLDVIGGANVYSHENDHPLIPTTRAFGDRILRHLSQDDLSSGRLRFHGRMGSDKVDIMRGADIAVLNVANRQECFPAAALECLDLGTPVVGSSANGLWDSMRHFPELSTRRPEEVPAIIAKLHAQPATLDALRDRSQRIASGFREENGLILERWEAVAVALLEGRRPPAHAPQPRPTSPLRLWAAWARRWTRHVARRTALADAVSAFIRGRR